MWPLLILSFSIFHPAGWSAHTHNSTTSRCTFLPVASEIIGCLCVCTPDIIAKASFFFFCIFTQTEEKKIMFLTEWRDRSGRRHFVDAGRKKPCWRKLGSEGWGERLQVYFQILYSRLYAWFLFSKAEERGVRSFILKQIIKWALAAGTCLFPPYDSESNQLKLNNKRKVVGLPRPPSPTR